MNAEKKERKTSFVVFTLNAKLTIFHDLHVYGCSTWIRVQFIFFKYGKMFTQSSIFYEKVLSRYFLWDFFQSKENFWNKHFRGPNLTQIVPTSFHNKSCVVRSLYMTTGTWRCYFFLQLKKYIPYLHVYQIFFFMTRKSNI